MFADLYLSKSSVPWNTKVNMAIIILDMISELLTHSRLTPSFSKYSQGLADKIPIIGEKAKGP